MQSRVSTEPNPTPSRRKLTHARSGCGVGQLSLVEHALCPLDPKASLQENLVFETSYYFTDSARHQQEARATVFCPLGLSATDEFFLWGLLALTFAQPEPDAELYATPHYVLRQLGVIDKGARRGGRQYDQFREAIERLSAVTYRNDRFYDPVRAEHRRVSFGFLSYSLPLDLQSSRAWRISWDAIFFEFVEAAGGHFQFDLATYRELDPASRRLFLFASKVFARRETTPCFDVRHLGEHVLGFSPTLDTRNMKVKVAAVVTRLVELGVLAPCADLFQKKKKGQYSLVLGKGPYFDRRSGSPRTASESALLEPLKAIGFDEASAARLCGQYSPRLLREWADITLAARERYGSGFFKRSPQAYFVDNIRDAAKGQRTAPDWWHEVRKAEQAAADQSASKRLVDDLASASKESELAGSSAEAYSSIRDRLFGEVLAGGATRTEAKALADRLARNHVARAKRQEPSGLTRAGSLIRLPRP